MSVLAAAVVLVAGLIGVVRGAQPPSGAASGTSGSVGGSVGSTSTMAPGMEGMSPDMAIVVTGAYVRQPANRINAAVYCTIYNTGGTPDTLQSVASGAGAQTSVHTESAGGGMQAGSAGGLSVPAHGSVALTPGKGHVMIEKLYGPLLAGQTVNLELTFARAGVVLVTVPVIAVTAPAPTAKGTPQ